ncbi:autotransporter domain-containing protein [Anaerospora hongkongensis]|uniref:autotransporter domain-containing protein n=1 Tax=Anaerospora hongkongensis TaxID=244830 RepID=UPI00289AB23A|nr:autotransporter domain-containing protein [Anaerospora hongkongensis]
MVNLSRIDFAANQHSHLTRPTRIKRRFLLAAIMLTLTLSRGGVALANDEIIDTVGNTINTPTSYSKLVVGQQGTGELIITDGGEVTAANQMQIASDSGSTGTLTVRNGGILTTNSGYDHIGGAVGSTGTVTVTGTGSLWTSSGMTVGINGGTGHANVTDGGTVSTTGLYLGSKDYLSTTAGTGTVTIDGSGSSLTSTGPVSVGQDGTGTLTLKNDATGSFASSLQVGENADSSGTLRVESGATLNTGNIYIGNQAGATGQATVTGSGSQWIGSNQLNVGLRGAGSLTVSDAGVARFGAIDIGRANGASGSVLVESGGSLTATGLVAVGYEAGATGSITVTGANSLLSADTISLGSSGSGTLAISDGGSLSITGAGLSLGANGGSATMTVSGAGTLWENNDGGVNIARSAGSTGSLTVSNGATARILKTGIYLGEGGQLTITGAGTQVEIGDPNAVNDANRSAWLSPDGGTVTVSAGANVYTSGTYVGAGGGSPVTMTVTGENTQLVGEQRIFVGGQSGSTNTGPVNGNGSLTISDGATAWAGTVGVGMDPNAQGSVVVTGTGSQLWAKANSRLTTPTPGNFYIGYAGNASVVVANGASIMADNQIRIAYAGGSGKLVIGALEGQAATAAGTVTATHGIAFGSSNTGEIIFNHTNTNYALDANISGAGQIIAENGVTTLTGNNTYTGGTTISGGTLAGTATSFGSGAIANNSALIVDGNGTLANTVSGSGSFTKTGSGTLTLTGNNTYTGGTTISGGTLSVTTDTLTGNVVNNATLLIDQDTDGTFAGNISGSGDLVKDGTGTVNMAGTLTYTGATTVLNGQLVGNTTALGGSVANNGQVAFDQSFAGTYNNVISGTGSLLKNGTGTVILTNDNTYTGGTTISGGTLQVGNGGTTGSITGDVVNNGVLAFDRSDGVTLSGQITGAGAIRQLGSGLVSLTGNSGTFTGTTTVETGSLKVNGTLGGVLDIQTSGRLQGTGTVGNLTMNGVIAPGNSIGTLNVAGDITFNTGSVYEVETNAAGQADRINASGTATINGGSVQVLAATGNYAPATTYTILSATNGVSGTFTDGVTSNLAFLDPSLSYDANNVYLRLTRNNVSFDGIGLTANQVATGKGTESLALGNSIYDAVLNLSSDQARYAFDQLSGEFHASVATTLIEDSRFVRNAMNDRLRLQANEPGVWSQAFGSWGHTGGNGNAAKMDRSTGGFLFGSDIPAFDNWRLGAVAGYSHTNLDVKDRHSSGSSDNYHLGLYGGSDWGQLGFRSGLAYTWHNIDTTRSVTLPGFSDRLSDGYNAGTFQAFSELSYGIEKGVTKFEPFANLSYVNFDANGLREHGGAAALTGSGVSMDTMFTTLGLRTATSVKLGKKAMTARGLLGWRHAYGDTIPTATLSYASGSSTFMTGGVPIARDAAVVEAGLDFTLSPTATLGISYNGQFANHLVDQSFKANLSMKF